METKSIETTAQFSQRRSEEVKNALLPFCSKEAANWRQDGYLMGFKDAEKLLYDDHTRMKEALERIMKIEDGAFGLKTFDVKRFKSDIAEALNPTNTK